VSQHLAKLRLAGLVTVRREGTFAYYAPADAHVRRLLHEALFHAALGLGDHADRVIGRCSIRVDERPAAPGGGQAFLPLEEAGAPSGTRTPNPLIKSQLLCQLS
jgi:hypothetical protein